MATARLDATYLIAGLVLDRRTREGVAGVQVEARDRDERFHDMLGQTFTDERGAVDYAATLLVPTASTER